MLVLIHDKTEDRKLKSRINRIMKRLSNNSENSEENMSLSESNNEEEFY